MYQQLKKKMCLKEMEGLVLLSAAFPLKLQFRAPLLSASKEKEVKYYTGFS